MAKTGALIPHIEAFVGGANLSSLSYQNSIIDAVVSLVEGGALTIEALVREMELYLTTTDHMIRGRGILLLAKVLTRLSSKPLDRATIHSLIEFFTSRLADWQALHGALVGCLALLRRKKGFGMVVGNDAYALAKVYLENINVQLLGVRDRKLCFELLTCLLDFYPRETTVLGEDLVYGICEAIDNEKDPHCLMLTFHIVETLGQLFPDKDGPVASFSEELFEILGRYFPIYFTHPNNGDLDIKRDDLSAALMRAFCSTPFFEPFAVPLLLEKLSSSLLLSKIDSLRYLSSCILHYGASPIKKHAKTIWHLLKDAVYTSTPPEPFSLLLESRKDDDSEEKQVLKEALSCLKTAVLQLKDSILCWITDDEEFDRSFLAVANAESYESLSVENQWKLNAIGSILSVSANASCECCCKILESYLPRLMNILGISLNDTSFDYKNTNKVFPRGPIAGALYLCVVLLSSCRDLTVTLDKIPVEPVPEDTTWFSLLQSIDIPLTNALGSVLTACSVIEKEGSGMTMVYCSVKGLQIFATFMKHFVQVSEVAYQNILYIFTTIIAERFEDSILWDLVLKALVQIGSFSEQSNDLEKKTCYMASVVDKLISLLHLDETGMPLPLKIEAVLAVGTTSSDRMSRIIQEIEVLILAKFSDVFVGENMNAAGTLVHLLNYYSSQVLPWCNQSKHFEKVALHFTLSFWNQIECISDIKDDLRGQEIFDSLMMAMKILVASCKEEYQIVIVNKVLNIIKSSISSPLKCVIYSRIDPNSVAFSTCAHTLSHRDELLISLFASVVIALRPETAFADVKDFLNLFFVLFLKGHSLAAQALGSIINKWPTMISGSMSVSFALEEMINTILAMDLLTVTPVGDLKDSSLADSIFQNLGSLYISSNNVPLPDLIVGLAWIGKGLLLRGHEKMKEVVLVFLKFMLSDSFGVNSHDSEPANGDAHLKNLLVARTAADAFNILLSDSDSCLNKKFNSIIRPLYKQRFFSNIMPLLLSSITESDSLAKRTILYRAFGHVFCNTPQAALILEAKKLIIVMLDSLSLLSGDVANKELVYKLFLVFSGILMDENGKDAIIENTHVIINRLLGLISYPHAMLVRETAIQCLIAMSGFPHAKIYPMRRQVLQAMSKALDDPKRRVRLEAIRCQKTWASIV